jgi:hypothetical protein
VQKHTVRRWEHGAFDTLGHAHPVGERYYSIVNLYMTEGVQLLVGVEQANVVGYEAEDGEWLVGVLLNFR